MIRINLLPVRAAKKKESVRFQVTVASLVTFLVTAVSLAAYVAVRSETVSLKTQIEQGNQEIEQLKKKIGELSRIKEQKRIIEEKLKIIDSLEAARTGPVNMFKRLRDAIPEKAWISSLKDEGTVITLKGFASDDEVVADFMRGLGRHKDWLVELEVAQRVVETETSSDVVSYIIKLEKTRQAQPQAAAEGK